jgi:hypothetical protein
MKEMKEAESNGGGRTRQGSTQLIVHWSSSAKNVGKMSGGEGNMCASHPMSGGSMSWDHNLATRGSGSKGWFAKQLRSFFS